MRKLVFLHTLLFCLASAFSQEEDLSNSFIDYMEGLMDDESTKLDYEEVLDQISLLRSNPLDLNTAQAEDFSTLPFLDEMDVQNIIRHREKYGNYQTLYELKNIPSLTQEKREQLLPFITISTDVKSFSWKAEWKSSKHLLYTHYQQVLQQKAGYIPDSSGNIKYAGSPERHYFKYMLQTPEKISFGLLGEKDAGENGPFDFYSAHLQLNNIWKFLRICIGDYKANFGQGLVIGNSSFFGKSTNTTNSYQQREGVQRYTSSNESSFLRGLGATLQHRNFTGTLFVSHKKCDGTLSQQHITSFKTDGLHRTLSEIEKKRNIAESLCGANLTFARKSASFGLTFLHYHYSDTLQPAEKSYNHFRLKETDQHWNMGFNYKYFLWKLKFFGEIATDAHLAIATLNGIVLQPSSRLSLLLLQRMYQPEYQANHANAFGENSRTENESGLYIGSKILPFKRVILSIYADVFRFPWPKYGIDYTSTGQEFLAHIQHNTRRWMNMQLKYKYKEFIEQGYVKQSLRYVNHLEQKGIRLQWLIETNQARTTESTNYGWVLSEDICHEWKRLHLSLNLHHAYFSATNYNNRFYIYEKDVLNSFSMPMLYGEGHRVALNMKLGIGRHMQVYLNGSSYFYTDGRESISSANEQIEGHISSTLKLLIKWNF